MARGRRTQRAPKGNEEGGAPSIIPCNIQASSHATIRETEDFYKARKTVKDHCRRFSDKHWWFVCFALFFYVWYLT